jgi:hypothetical protein
VVKAVVGAVILSLAGLAEAAAKVTVPFDVQVPLVLKALTYDRNLKSRVSEQVRIAVLVQKEGKGAAAELKSAFERISARTVAGMSVVFTEIEVGEDMAFESRLSEGQWAAVYVMPGFAQADLAKVRRVCEARRVLPVASVVDDLDHGLAFGIRAFAGRPQIVVNLPASKACGSDFDLALLELSKVVR